MSQSDAAPGRGRAPSGLPCRCRPALAAARLFVAAGLPGLSVVRLGPGRWRAAAPLSAPELAVYLSPDEGGVIQAVGGGDRLDIRIEGMPGEAGVANLGDCLVEALERGVGHIGLVLADPDRELPLAVEALLESLVRLPAGQGGRPGVTVAGDGPAAAALRRAIARGLGRRRLGRRVAGGRP